jgi:hypothetical protein
VRCAAALAAGLVALTGACGGSRPAELGAAPADDGTAAAAAGDGTAVAAAGDGTAEAADAVAEPDEATAPSSGPGGDEGTAGEASEVSPAAPIADGPRIVRLGGSGDFLAHIRVVSSARGHGGFEHVLGALRRAVRPDEVAFLNLETPLSEERPVSSGSPPILGAPPEAAAVMASIGIDVASVANNHAWDQFSVGAGRTIEALEGAGLVALGAGPTVEAAFAPRFVTAPGGVRVAFVGVTERVNGGPGPLGPSTLIARWEEDGPLEDALAAARAEAELVVVSVHWSHDFRMTPQTSQRARARWLVERGADVILGHGPHVLQEVERLPSPRGEAVCAYSLGNLVSNQGYLYHPGRRAPRDANIATWLPEARDGVWLTIDAELEDGRVRITEIAGVPLFTWNDHWERRRGAPEDIRIALVHDLPDATLRRLRFREITAALGPTVTLPALPAE